MSGQGKEIPAAADGELSPHEAVALWRAAVPLCPLTPAAHSSARLIPRHILALEQSFCSHIVNRVRALGIASKETCKMFIF